MKSRRRQFFDVTFPHIAIWTVPVLVIVIGYLIYNGYQYRQDQAVRYSVLEEKMEQNNLLHQQLLASTSAALASSISIIEENLSLTKSESSAVADALKDALNTEKQKLANLQQQTEQIGGTLGEIEKLSQIDPELLLKYSKVSFLNEHYVPSSLSEIRNQFLYSEKETKYFHTNAHVYLTNMLSASVSAGKTIYVKSAYRSFNEQEKVKDGHAIVYGEGANAFSADQGYSEHQLGTTVDLITTGFNGELLESFDATGEFTWLQANAYKYGFTLSYPKGNAYYTYEPWHWRFVGIELATKLHNENKNFYDIDQRTIDEYLISLFD